MLSSSGLVCDAAEVNAFGRLKETCKGAVRVLKRTLEAYCCHTHTQQKSGQLATIVLMAALKFVLYCLCTFCSFLYFTAAVLSLLQRCRGERASVALGTDLEQAALRRIRQHRFLFILPVDLWLLYSQMCMHSHCPNCWQERAHGVGERLTAQHKEQMIDKCKIFKVDPHLAP